MLSPEGSFGLSINQTLIRTFYKTMQNKMYNLRAKGDYWASDIEKLLMIQSFS
jgi:hypothetical protein